MDNKKQKLLIEILVSSPDTFALCQTILVPAYFDPEYINTVAFIKDYFEKYNTVPSPLQVEGETNLKLTLHKVTPDQIKYCAAELEEFCQESAMRTAILASPELIQAGKFAEAAENVKEAAMVSLTKNLGLRYFNEVEDRLDRMLNEDPTSPTGWGGIDDALFGGISRKELLLVSANSGGGKSITLANLGFNFVNAGHNVLYISLELSEDIVGQRFDTMFTGIGRKIWKDNVDKIKQNVSAASKKAGHLDIVQMPAGTTANNINAYLKEFYLKHGMMPDLLILDYLDNMAPNEHVSADNVFEKDKRSSEQLRQLGVDHNMFIATASQLNRGAVNATEHNHSQIAGGISKINVSDVYWSIIMTDEMRAMGKILFVLQKTRNSDGVGKQVFLKWDNKFLRIVNEDNDDTSSPLVFNKKIDSNSPPRAGEDGAKGLGDLMGITTL